MDVTPQAGLPMGDSADAPLRAWPFGELRMFGYSVVLLDPPWRFVNYSAKGEQKNPSAHYGCLTLAQLKALPVGDLAAPDSAMVMWAIAPMLDKAFELMAAYGFQFKTAGSWAKQSSTGQKWAFGPGYVLRAATEFFLIGTVGSPKICSRSVRNLIVAPTREHSRKPDQMHRNLEALYGDVPRCELFARAPRAGWDVWGNQTDRFAQVAA